MLRAVLVALMLRQSVPTSLRAEPAAFDVPPADQVVLLRFDVPGPEQRGQLGVKPCRHDGPCDQAANGLTQGRTKAKDHTHRNRAVQRLQPMGIGARTAHDGNRHTACSDGNAKGGLQRQRFAQKGPAKPSGHRGVQRKDRSGTARAKPPHGRKVEGIAQQDADHTRYGQNPNRAEVQRLPAICDRHDQRQKQRHKSLAQHVEPERPQGAHGIGGNQAGGGPAHGSTKGGEFMQRQGHVKFHTMRI